MDPRREPDVRKAASNAEVESAAGVGERLKPCPFCGNAPVLREITEHYPAEGSDAAGSFVCGWSIDCDNCAISHREEYHDDAVAAWNRRAPQAQGDGVVEALRKTREALVLSIAFYGRDAGTDRERKSLDQLHAIWVEADKIAIAALAPKEGAPAADLRAGPVGLAAESIAAMVEEWHSTPRAERQYRHIPASVIAKRLSRFLPAQAAEPVAVTVKPLDWDERNEAFYADTILGECEIAEQGDGYWYVIVDGRKHSDFLTRLDAQGYMQEQHRRLVTDWIAPPALSGGGAAPQAVEDAR